MTLYKFEFYFGSKKNKTVIKEGVVESSSKETASILIMQEHPFEFYDSRLKLEIKVVKR